MIVVADTGPINYLVLIGHIDVLPALYRRVLVPIAVQQELLHVKTPQAVRDFIAAPPDWFEVHALTTSLDPSLAGLDSGESQAISLAKQVAADRIVMDESLGRRIAESHGLHVIGTLGILREASNRGLLDIRQAIVRLQQNRFHVAKNILDDILSD